MPVMSGITCPHHVREGSVLVKRPIELTLCCVEHVLCFRFVSASAPHTPALHQGADSRAAQADLRWCVSHQLLLCSLRCWSRDATQAVFGRPPAPSRSSLDSRPAVGNGTSGRGAGGGEGGTGPAVRHLARVISALEGDTQAAALLAEHGECLRYGVVYVFVRTKGRCCCCCCCCGCRLVKRFCGCRCLLETRKLLRYVAFPPL